MLIRQLTIACGPDTLPRWPGDVYEADEATAAELIKGGYAEALPDEQKGAQ